ncbi:efflux RND transporter periplasmic adaptor subunit [Dokdonella sp.]|uniref:efflux RND transporter periplasmic adaptor subunit n=1 Tax=Dokdonella sp. TaxID=2291710 RepID=UPI002F41200C
MRSSSRWLPLAAAAALAACSGERATSQLPPLPDLPILEVTPAGASRGQGWDGVVEAMRRADLSAQTAGTVDAVEVDVNDRVDAAAVLVRISAVEQDAVANTARAQLRAAEASAVVAEQNFRRFSTLSDARYGSRAQLDQARAERDAAVAARDAARARLAQAAQQAGYTVVRAPFAGVVARRDVEPGETVAPGQPLLSVYAPHDLRIEVSVPQTRAEAIRRDPRARVRLPDGRELAPTQVVVFPAADDLSHSVVVRLALPATAAPPAPGTTAKVVFDAAAPEGEAEAQPVSIPRASVAQRGELSAVYVRQGDRILLRQVRLGAHHGDDVDVISGLRAGDAIVRDPVAAVQALAAQRRAVGAAHE